MLSHSTYVFHIAEKHKMILGLPTAIYPTADLQGAKAWYQQVLEREPYFDEPFCVGFAVGSFELGLISDGEAGTSGPQPLWGVDNADTALARSPRDWAPTLIEPTLKSAAACARRLARTHLAIGSGSSRIGTSSRPKLRDGMVQ